MPILRRSPGPWVRLLPALIPFAAPGAGEDPWVLWRGTSRTLEELEREAGPAPAAAARPWVDFARKQGYRLHLAEEGEALLVLPGRGSSAEDLLELVRATAARLDPLLPDARKRGASLPTAKDLADGELPPPLGSQPVEASRAAHATPVLVQLRDTKDYKAALDHLAQRHAYLRAWAEQAKGGLFGFVLLEPLVGGWLEEAPSSDPEWDPRNELVNRFAQLALLDRAGRQPYWLQVGLAWNVEQAVRGAIYCFPYRSGFVGIGEHGGWGPALKRQLKGKDASPTMAQIDALRRGSYDDTAAGWAWGTARFLMQEHPAALPKVLEDFDAIRRREGIVDHGDGTWTVVVEYEIPQERQLEVLRRRCGEDFLTELGDFLRGIEERPGRKRASRK